MLGKRHAKALAQHSHPFDRVVAKYNHDVRVITLENGRSYTVPRDVALPPLEAGEKVSIILNDEGDRVTAVLKSY